ncbi:MAG: ribonuclease P protein subunit [Candidatus Micrarchaeota archaeon]
MEYAFLLDELIGEEVKVLRGSSKHLQRLEGRIIDESRNTFLLDTPLGRKRIAKATCTFFFPSRKIEIEGEMLVARPEDRTKKLGKDLGLH